MDLAVTFGRPVLSLLEEMTQWELAMWIAVAKKRPMGLRLYDASIGIQAATMANTVRTRGKKAAEPADFTPWQRNFEDTGGFSKADLQMMQFVKAHNAKVKSR